MSTLIGIIAAVLLFVVFGLLHRNRERARACDLCARRDEACSCHAPASRSGMKP